MMQSLACKEKDFEIMTERVNSKPAASGTLEEEGDTPRWSRHQKSIIHDYSTLSTVILILERMNHMKHKHSQANVLIIHSRQIINHTSSPLSYPFPAGFVGDMLSLWHSLPFCEQHHLVSLLA